MPRLLSVVTCNVVLVNVDLLIEYRMLVLLQEEII
jgi:hypothetical protein